MSDHENQPGIPDQGVNLPTGPDQGRPADVLLPPQEGQESPEFEVDPVLLQAAMETFRSQQNLVGGLVGGLVAALVGAGIWAAITIMTGYQLGLIAIAVGYLAGMGVRMGGKGMDKIFGAAGAGLAFFGCLLGNLAIVCYFAGEAQDLAFTQVLSLLTPGLVVELMAATFSPMDIVFYGIAIYQGYKVSFRTLTEEELLMATQGSAANFSG